MLLLCRDSCSPRSRHDRHSRRRGTAPRGAWGAQRDERGRARSGGRARVARGVARGCTKVDLPYRSMPDSTVTPWYARTKRASDTGHKGLMPGVMAHPMWPTPCGTHPVWHPRCGPPYVAESCQAKGRGPLLSYLKRPIMLQYRVHYRSQSVCHTIDE
jgi:hypothetical protein